ncbi:FAD-dependent monooxygenase [Streptomyces sp. NPDC102383]|uniref:FAD-dependent monooxygenase n=1 Tax=Streptomyces sp. NPDC102383 TaxID=3366165 RepID=UPI0038019AD1
MKLMEHVELAIVGGGPVGLLLAAEAGRYGIRTTVMETETAIADQPKANTLHARAIQSLVRCGYAAALPPGRDAPGNAVSFHFAGLDGLTIRAPEHEPTPLAKCPQADLERVFEEHARAKGVQILRGHRATHIRRTRDRVHLAVRSGHDEHRISADYVAAADGAHSFIREQIGFTKDFHAPRISVLLGVVRFADPASAPAGWHRSRRGWTVARDFGDGYTLIRAITFTGTPPDRRAPVTVEDLQREASYILGRDLKITETLHLRRFSDVAMLAHRFIDGRIALVGDAAHTHFPIGGQGLSTGIQDALNLGWKLAHCIRGTAGKGLLETYDKERRPAASRVIDNTRAQTALMRPDPELDPLRALFTELIRQDQGRGHLSGAISAQDTRYPPRLKGASAWEGRFLENLMLMRSDGRPTDVVELLAAGRPLLLLSEPEADSTYRTQSQAWDSVVSTVTVQPRSGLPCDALLLRPDGYVAWASDSADPLPEALRVWFGDGP